MNNYNYTYTHPTMREWIAYQKRQRQDWLNSIRKKS